MEISRGDIYWVDFGATVGSEQNGVRPCVIIQNNMGNNHSKTTIVAPMTTKIGKSKVPTHVFIRSDVSGLKRDNYILCEQLRVIDKSRIISDKVGILSYDCISRVNIACLISLGI